MNPMNIKKIRPQSQNILQSMDCSKRACLYVPRAAARGKSLSLVPRPLSLIFLLLSFFSLLSCTHPNGDIGSWFGSWLIEEVKADGVVQDDGRQVVIAFQGKVFECAYAGDYRIYGSWQEEDGKLLLDASYGAGGTSVFPAILGFGSEQKISLTILSQDSKHMKWSWTSPSGVKYNYTLQKLP